MYVMPNVKMIMIDNEPRIVYNDQVIALLVMLYDIQI